MSTWEGMAAAVFFACTSGTVLTAWGLHLGGGPALLGLLAALPFLAQVLQVPAAALTSRFGAKRVALSAALVGRQIFWALVVLPFAGASGGLQLGAVLTVATVASLAQGVCLNAWTTWMGDLVPSRVRGRYFGIRVAWTLLAGALGNLLAGLVLDAARARGREGESLALLSLVAVGAGALTVAMLKRQRAGRSRAKPLELVEGLRAVWAESPLRRLLAFLTVWSLAIGVAVPFWGLFMLEDLQLSFTWLALHQLGSTLVRFVSAPVWGRAMDRVGSRRVLVFCSFAVTGVPLLWLFPTPERLWPVVLDAVVAGLLWSGHDLATFQLPLDLSSQRLRPYAVGLLSMVAGLMTALSGVLGGLAVDVLPRTVALAGVSISRLQVLFLLTSLLRLGGALVSLRLRQAAGAAAPSDPALTLAN